jgi:hypothetical protein
MFGSKARKAERESSEAIAAVVNAMLHSVEREELGIPYLVTDANTDLRVSQVTSIVGNAGLRRMMWDITGFLVKKFGEDAFSLGDVERVMDSPRPDQLSRDNSTGLIAGGMIEARLENDQQRQMGCPEHLVGQAVTWLVIAVARLGKVGLLPGTGPQLTARAPEAKPTIATVLRFCASSPERLNLEDPVIDGMGIDEPASLIRGTRWQHSSEVSVARAMAGLVIDSVNRRRVDLDFISRIMGQPDDSAFFDERHALGAAASIYLEDRKHLRASAFEAKTMAPTKRDFNEFNKILDVPLRPRIDPAASDELDVLPEIISWLGILVLRLRHVGAMPSAL